MSGDVLGPVGHLGFGPFGPGGDEGIEVGEEGAEEEGGGAALVIQPVSICELLAALDVGGSGGLAIDVVRGSAGATALGVDLSTAQLEVARHQAGGLPVTFEQADAQVRDFGAHAFDVIASRTGTMFFTDMAMAFANLARATRLGGRLVMLVWRGIEDNEWLREFFGAIGRVLPMAPPRADAPGPFSLSDPDRVRDLLHGAGWSDVNFTAKDELLCFGPDVASSASRGDDPGTGPEERLAAKARVSDQG